MSQNICWTQNIFEFKTFSVPTFFNQNYLHLAQFDLRREKLCLKFAQRCLKKDQTKKMFPYKLKYHKMKTRATEKYQVQHANTKRLQNSRLIYMQNFLNSKDESQQ